MFVVGDSSPSEGDESPTTNLLLGEIVMREKNVDLVEMEYPELPQEEIRQVVLKLMDDTAVPPDEPIETYLPGWKELAAAYPGIAIVPLCHSLTPDEIREHMARAKEYDPAYAAVAPNFLNYFAVTYPSGTEAEFLRRALASAWEFVEYATLSGYVPPPPLVNAANEPWRHLQIYLNAAPVGVDAAVAWQQPGGHGAGVCLCDLEQGWGLAINHEDLPLNRITLASGVDKAYWAHGTAVLGIIAAVDNQVGMVGIAPGVAHIDLVSLWRADGTYNPYDALWHAIHRLVPGDVILLETQTDGGLPIEHYAHMHQLIRQAVAEQIVVVEAAGNGGRLLDTAVNNQGSQVWNPAGPYVDSGAVLVAAANVANGQYTATAATNRGRRVDCFAWGAGVATTAVQSANPQANNLYTNGFNGTSAAAAIVAGTAVALQGIAKARHNGQPLSPWQMRHLLKQGTPSANGHLLDGIGVMPNLVQIVAALP
ncbi:MAG: peptidase S8/S53 subtilisin kexin sedolisin [Chloroflexi bacterium]|nr:peptidase S8/S53 subtilisin kexin sedolisin [Chloroflexota bacterium]